MNDRIFLDINVLLDHLLDRAPFADDAAELWALAERGSLPGYVSAISFNILYYVVRRAADGRGAMRAVRAVRDVFGVVAVDKQIIDQAIDSRFDDFEDAIQHACAVRVGATHLVTRDPRGYRRSEMQVVSPAEFLAGFRDEQQDD